MRALSLAEALPDFGRAAVTAFAANPPRPQPTPEPEPRDVSTSDAEWQARLDRAVADAQARAAISLQEALEAERERLAEAHRIELEAVSRDFATTMGETIAARLQEVEDRVAHITTSAAARLLSGVLTEALATRSVARMEAVLRTAIEDREAVSIVVRGPASLYEPLRSAMGDHADRMRFVEAPTPDLSVSIDETVYETRLAEWSDALTGVFP